MRSTANAGGCYRIPAPPRDERPARSAPPVAAAGGCYHIPAPPRDGWPSVAAGPADLEPEDVAACAPPASRTELPRVDRALFRPSGGCGFISEFVACGMADALHPNEPLLFLSALAACATLAGQGFRTDRNAWPNQYVVGVAPTSTGKDAGQKLAAHLLARLGVGDRIGGRPGSGPALQDFLLLAGVKLFNSDECADLFKNLHAKGNGEPAGASLNAQLLAAWSASAGVYHRRQLKPDPKAAKVPAAGWNLQATFCGWAQPGAFFDALSPDDLASGLLGRCLVLEGDPLSLNESGANLYAPTDALLDWGRRILESGGRATFTGEDRPAPLVVSPADASAAGYRLDLLRKETKMRLDFETQGDHAAAAAYGKTFEKAEKFALLYAVAENPEAPALTVAGFEWAWRLVTTSTAALFERVRHLVARTDHERNVNRVLALLRERGGSVPVRELCRKFKDLKPADLQSALETLRNGELAEVRIVRTRTNPRKDLVLLG